MSLPRDSDQSARTAQEGNENDRLQSHLQEDISAGRLKSNLRLEGKDRAIYNVKFDGRPLDIDVETVYSRIIEYQFYLAFKTQDEGYSQISEIAQRYSATKSKALFPVCIIMFHYK